MNTFDNHIIHYQKRGGRGGRGSINVIPKVTCRKRKNVTIGVVTFFLFFIFCDVQENDNKVDD
jgi:hypothetical protein